MVRLFSNSVGVVAICSLVAANNGAQVEICHLSKGRGYHVIKVAERSVPAHEAHGDGVVDDGLPCTFDVCDPDDGALHFPDHSLCEDDDDLCTVAFCDAQLGCQQRPKCDDGEFCNGTEMCDPDTGACSVISACPPTGIPPGVCLRETCDEVNDECLLVRDESLCGESNACEFRGCDTDTDECLPPVIVDCAECHTCDPVEGCVPVPGCQPPGGPCTVEVCTPSGCSNIPDDSLCEDDGDLCTVEFCDAALGCQREPKCDDGEFCNGTEMCDPATGACSVISACPPAGFPPNVCLRQECDEANDTCLVVRDESLCGMSNACESRGCDTLTDECFLAIVDCTECHVCDPVEGCVPVAGCVPQ